MLEYTGHPLVDVGIATITAFVDKRRPDELNENDLDKIADYMIREYLTGQLRSFLTATFLNSGFTQPRFSHEQRLEYAKRVLRSYKDTTPLLDDAVCVFTGMPAVDVVLKEKEDISAGRAFRQHIPLLTGENIINFHAGGYAGLPVSGVALLAIHAFPLGCARSKGKLLAVHSDNPKLILHFARSFLENNRKSIGLDQGMAEPNPFRGTLVIETLRNADIKQQRAEKEKQPLSLTVYHLTSGRSPGLEMYHLPLQVIKFLREMGAPDYREQWQKIVNLAWETEAQKKKKKNDKPFHARRNGLYEDILELYDGLFLRLDNAKAFLRTYFLRRAFRSHRVDQNTPQAEHGLPRSIDLVSWDITAYFLEEVLQMEQERIEEIRKMGDRLAEYINKHNDVHLYTNFRHNNYGVFRTNLLRANNAEVKRGNPPIVGFDPYIEVFELAENDYRLGWRFNRDLVLLRMVEQLHKLGWFGKNSDIELDIHSEEENSQSE